MKRDLLSIQDLSQKEIQDLIELTQKLKSNKAHAKGRLEGKSVGLVFQKPSNRTRVSFDVGITQLGGNCIYLGPEEINLGVRESTSDVAKTLSRYLDCIVARTHTHEDLKDLAKYATIPVINGLSDLSHPCQGLTDLFSIYEKFHKLEGLTLVYIGDGNNVCHSLMLGASKVGMHMNIATPCGYEPDAKVMDWALANAKRSGAKIKMEQDPQAAVKGADVIYSDVWVSMGQEAEGKTRKDAFKGFQINADLVKAAGKDFIFMHCLPAHRGEEVTAEIIDGPHSIVFDQAENRLHTQKAVLITYLSN